MIRSYSQIEQAQAWLERYQSRPPVFACVLGFTATGLIPGISAAGATPLDRQYTAIADAEFLVYGPQSQPQHPLPPLSAGVSPVFITRSVVATQHIPVTLFNAGLLHAPTVPCTDLAGQPAHCLSQGNAMTLSIVKHLFQQGLYWGDKLADRGSYVILSECVVGGTTTALAVLTGLGWAAAGKVNSSHPTCNHLQKWQLVQAGLRSANWLDPKTCQFDPLRLVAAVGDPMQITVAGMMIAASRRVGVLLAGGTQMIAVYALAQAIASHLTLAWHPQSVVIGTTRWVVEDPTGDTIGLADLIGVPLIGSQLCFASSQYAQLRAYEQGYVKEGVGAGGCAIVSALYQGWTHEQLLAAIESLVAEYARVVNREK
ncbi:nicotinate mononucleotide-dependent phosphoribosyltransferase CobT [Thermocoleostomius sinensis]|uniref:UPF0284 protein OXH18_06370 n=1 Tax=Thermocoleostomius sinensis A174 TaxID=2016057 RepID=A0A9E9C5W2_9CYAN|nr:TIGR00303 family protein [Thermocoleostomius sinensis]WAL61606.1 TIGR00303 family protein [Thermocoleostomius sinensis A174]